MNTNSPVWDFEHSVECEANRKSVWLFWTDVSNWKRIECNAVEWIRLEGPFQAGSQGVTKSPGQEPRRWTIADIDSEASATIEMPVNGAMFVNRMTFERLSANRTRITQRLSLCGEVSTDMLTGIKTFEATAPEGLAKLASVIESDERAAGLS